MKDPERLPHVLHALLGHPALPRLLNNPPALASYLRTGWRDIDPEETGPYGWGTDHLEPDSQEASEEAEILPMVEEQIDRLELTTPQRQAIYTAVRQVCPEAIPILQITMSEKAENLNDYYYHDDQA